MNNLNYIFIGLIATLSFFVFFFYREAKQAKQEVEELKIRQEKLFFQYHKKRQSLQSLQDSLTERFEGLQISNDSLDEELKIVNTRLFDLNKWHEKKYHDMDTASVEEVLQYFKENFYKD